MKPMTVERLRCHFAGVRTRPEIRRTTHTTRATAGMASQGVVGTVGRILGEAGVNIGGMQVSRDDAGNALTVLTVDSAIAPDQLQAIISEISAASGKAVDLA